MSFTTQEQTSFEEYAAIEAALQPYRQAAKTGDGKAAVSTFFDHIRVVGSINGEYYELDKDTFENVVTEDGPSPNAQSHIAWINVSGPAAAARVELLDWSGRRYTDFFVLYKVDGVWKISGKTFDSHSKN